MQPEAVNEVMKQDLARAFAMNSMQQNIAEPLDWIYNNQPQEWMIDGKICTFDWVMDSYPTLLSGKTQDY
jgi:hypothetical protein